MKKIITLILFFVLLVSYAFSQETSEKFMTVKLKTGYNFWVLGAALINGEAAKYLSPGSFMFEGDILFLDPQSIQFGVEVAYLPMLVASATGESGEVKGGLYIIPVTANVVFNTGFFYTDLGLGLGFLNASLSASSESISESLSYSSPELAFLGKVGIGLNFKFHEYVGIDVGTSMYLPFTPFGLTKEKLNPFLVAILFSQFNLNVGVSFYF